MAVTMIWPADSGLRDPRVAWVAIQEAVRAECHDDLAEIAISLYGQLGEARAEVGRLRAALHSSLGVLTPAGAGDG